MKIIGTITMTLFLVFSAQAQELTKNDRRVLNNLKVAIDSTMDHESQYTLHLKDVVIKNRKAKKNKIIGGLVGSIGLLTAGIGTLIIIDSSLKQNGNEIESNPPVAQVFGGVLVAVGAVEISVGIPVFKKGNKRKRERDRLIQELNAQYADTDGRYPAATKNGISKF